jgi:oligopeptide transport system permease protein
MEGARMTEPMQEKVTLFTANAPDSVAEESPVIPKPVIGRTKSGFWRQPKAYWSSLVLLGVLLIATLGPILGPDSTIINADCPLAPPWPMTGFAPTHWLGTDDLGRDLFSRLAFGARISLLIGMATAVVSVVIGTSYGVIAALCGARAETAQIESAMMRFIDILYALPALMIVILFSVFLGRGMLSLVLVLSLFSWPDTARIIRSQVLGLQKEEFIEAFHSLGGGVVRLIWRHFIPNMLNLIILTATITVPRAILTESTLSFIGLGIEPPLSSWGSLAGEGWQMVRIAPILLIFPALFIVVTMIALNLLGDSLQDFCQPRKSR